MRRLVTTIAALLILPVVFAAGEATAQDKIRIPFATAFSGPAIEFGERLWRGSQIATEEINAAGGVRGKMLEFYKIDSRSPETIPIITEYRRACNDEKIPMMVANTSSKQLFAIYEYAKQCNMATFAPTSGAYWVFPDNGKWVFRFLPQPQTMLPYLYGKVKEEFGFKTVIISFTIDDDSSFFNYKLGRKILLEKGFEIVGGLSSKRSETNFASQVAAIRATKADFIILSQQPDDGGKMLLQIRERGVKSQIVDTGGTVGGRDFWKLSKGHAKGAIGTATYTSDDPRPIVQNWVKLWRERSGKTDSDPDPYETAAYDGAKVVAEVLRTAKSMSRKDISDAFTNLKDFETVSGTIEYRSQDLPDVYRSVPVLVQLGDNNRLLSWPKKK